MSSFRTASGLIKDYYDLLGVSRTAGRAEIDKAYKRRVRRVAPRLDPRTVQDANLRADAELSFELRNEKARELNEAYEVLTDPRERAEYDRLLDAGGGGSGHVRLVADPPVLYFGEVGRGESPARGLRIGTEPPGRADRGELRVVAAPWLEVEAEPADWDGEVARTTLHLRVRLIASRMPFSGMLPGQVTVFLNDQRVDVAVVAMLRSEPDDSRAWTYAQPERGAAPHTQEHVTPERTRAPSLTRVIFLQLLGMAAVLGVFLLFQLGIGHTLLGLALLVGVLVLLVETHAFKGIDRHPWYVKGVAGVVLAGVLPLAMLLALAQ